MKASPLPVQKITETISKEERKTLTSNFSLKSIKLKQEALKNAKEEIIDPNNLPREAFSKEDFLKYWKLYISELHQNGAKIQASNLETSIPSVEGTTIKLEVVNNTAKNEILREDNKLLGFLQKSLRNYDLKMELFVSETLSKKLAFTPEDKYERLLEINPILKDFRKAFDLNLSF